MTKEEKNKQKKQDIVEEMQDELQEVENENLEIDEDKLEEAEKGGITSEEYFKCKETLARSVADFENFKKRVERDREDMIFFLKGDIFKKILPRIDDLERILKNTPEDEKKSPLYEGLKSIENKFKKDLQSLGVNSFDSIGEKINPEKHDVMTTIPGKEGIIVDEFEKGYLLGDKVLRVAKVVVGNGGN